MTTIYVSGLQQFTRARLRVPGPSVTLQQLMEAFCKEQRLGSPDSYVFSAFVAVHALAAHACFTWLWVGAAQRDRARHMT